MIIRSIDFETTGFPPGAAVIEIGWTDIEVTEEAVNVLAPQSMLVNPFMANPSLVMTSGAQAVHLIDKEELQGAPSPEVGFRTLTDGPDVFLAHNAEFEQKFFTGGERPWICTLKASRRIYPNAPSHKLQELRFALPVHIPDREYARAAHRAGPDAYVAALLLVKLLQDGANIPDMISWSSGPSILPTMPFGKHKGLKFEAIPFGYLDWLSGTDLSADLRATIKQEIARRGSERDGR